VVVASGTRALGAAETTRHAKGTKAQKTLPAPVLGVETKGTHAGTAREGRAEGPTLGRRQAPVTRWGEPEKRKGRAGYLSRCCLAVIGFPILLLSPLPLACRTASLLPSP
jgi:hypothetical protein